MTSQQAEHLDLLDAYLDTLLAKSAKRTGGVWRYDPSFSTSRVYSDIIPHTHIAAAAGHGYSEPKLQNIHDNAAFIAIAANNAEAGWRSLKNLIHFLRRMPGSMSGQEAIAELLAEWPLEKLNIKVG